MACHHFLSVGEDISCGGEEDAGSRNIYTGWGDVINPHVLIEVLIFFIPDLVPWEGHDVTKSEVQFFMIMISKQYLSGIKKNKKKLLLQLLYWIQWDVLPFCETKNRTFYEICLKKKKKEIMNKEGK